MSFESTFDLVPLGSVASFINGDRSTNYPKGDDYVADGIPFISAADLTDGSVQKDGVKRISLAAYSRLRSGKIQHKDVLFCLRGSIGKLAFVRPSEVGAIASSLVIVRGNEEKIDARYLYFILYSQAGQQAAASLNNGSAQPNLSVGELQKVQIPLPSVVVQRAIAGILDAFDDRITLLRETNATLEAIAQALFKSWFVDFDPVRAKMAGRALEGMDEATAALFPDALEETELGVVPKGWRFASLSSIATVTMGLSPKGESYNSEGFGIPLINGPVEFGDYFPVQSKWTTAGERMAKKGDLIFCVRGSTTGRRVIADGTYCIGRGVCSIRASDDLNAFLYQTINFGLNRLLANTTGSVFPSLSGPDIKGFQVLAPSTEVMRAYEGLVTTAVARQQCNQMQMITLAEMRDQLLPRLISGQLRLPKALPPMAAMA
jgi:type I restriction enzyme, S subunit